MDQTVEKKEQQAGVGGATSTVPQETRTQGQDSSGRGGSQFGRKKNVRRSTRPPRVRSEFDQKIINIRRVTRVSSGGRRFSFSVAMIIGNRKGSVGVGTGKGLDTSIAIDKAVRSAKKNLIVVPTTPSQSIAHRIDAKYSSARVMLMPSQGRGVVAGSAARSVLELAGVKDVTAKIFSPSKNALNTARATILALSRLKRSVGGFQAKKIEKASEKNVVENSHATS